MRLLSFLNTLQAQQSELEKAMAASLCRGETNAFGGRARLTTSEGADKQASSFFYFLLLLAMYHPQTK